MMKDRFGKIVRKNALVVVNYTYPYLMVVDEVLSGKVNRINGRELKTGTKLIIDMTKTIVLCYVDGGIKHKYRPSAVDDNSIIDFYDNKIEEGDIVYYTRSEILSFGKLLKIKDNSKKWYNSYEFKILDYRGHTVYVTDKSYILSLGKKDG